MKYQAIIFDCDGVLVDSEAISCGVLIDLAKELGVEFDLSYAVKHFSGTSLKYVMDHIQSLLGAPLPKDFEKKYRGLCTLRFQTQIKPVKGIVDVLEALRVPFCVASNGPLSKMDLNLRLTGLDGYFRGKMFSAYEINAWKPDPALFLTAAKFLGVEPKKCAVIEDSLAGVQAGIKGGFDVYALSHTHQSNVLKNEGAIVFKEMTELLPLLS